MDRKSPRETCDPRIHDIWKEADAIWEAHRHEAAFHGYVSADYVAVLEELTSLKNEADSFLEWGSGLGVVTLMASLVGFEACGIEAETELVDYADDFATRFDIEADFAVGSFIPDGFDWDPATGANVTITQIDAPEAYSELGVSLDEFDVVYAYPWPDEHQLLQEIMTHFGNRNATLLTYDAHEGIQRWRQ